MIARLRNTLLLLLPAVAHGATYYVDPAGNDANAGTSPAPPWQTVAKTNSATYAAGCQILTFSWKILVFVSVITLLTETAINADTIIDGDLHISSGGGLVFSDGSVQWQASVQGPAGPAGPANSLTVGIVQTGNPGTAAGASITGTAPNQTLNLLIPQGPNMVNAFTTTTLTGLMKGDGVSVGVASAGIDYLTPSGNGSGLTGITATQITGLPAASAATPAFSTTEGSAGSITTYSRGDHAHPLPKREEFVTETVADLGTCSGTVTIAAIASEEYSVLLGDNCTIKIPRQPSGKAAKFVLTATQAASGGPYTLTLQDDGANAVKYPGGSGYTMSTGASTVDVIAIHAYSSVVRAWPSQGM